MSVGSAGASLNKPSVRRRAQERRWGAAASALLIALLISTDFCRSAAGAAEPEYTDGARWKQFQDKVRGIVAKELEVDRRTVVDTARLEDLGWDEEDAGVNLQGSLGDAFSISVSLETVRGVKTVAELIDAVRFEWAVANFEKLKRTVAEAAAAAPKEGKTAYLVVVYVSDQPRQSGTRNAWYSRWYDTIYSSSRFREEMKEPLLVRQIGFPLVAWPQARSGKSIFTVEGIPMFYGGKAGDDMVHVIEWKDFDKDTAPASFIRTLRQTVGADRETIAAPSPTRPSVAARLEALEELRRAKTITEDEYRARRAKILDDL